MLRRAILAERHQFWIRLRDDILMLDWDGGDFNAQQFRCALRMVSCCSHNMFGSDHLGFFRRNQIAALFYHLGDGDAPCVACPFIAINLPFALDDHATLARALGHGLGHVCRVDIAVSRVEQRPFEIFGAHKRVAVFNLRRRQPLVGDTNRLSGGCIKTELIHTCIGLRHAQVTDHSKPCVEACLFFQRLIEFHRIVVNMAGCVAHVEQGQKSSRVPCRARGQFIPLQQHHILPSRFCKMIGNRCANGTAADNQGFDMCLHDIRSRA